MWRPHDAKTVFKIDYDFSFSKMSFRVISTEESLEMTRKSERKTSAVSIDDVHIWLRLSFIN